MPRNPRDLRGASGKGRINTLPAFEFVFEAVIDARLGSGHITWRRSVAGLGYHTLEAHSCVSMSS